jgi:dolichyl-phosphate beta-glucosyltransferase
MNVNESINLSIIIPSYNEKQRIARTLDAYLHFFNKKKISFEIIIADYSNDGSKNIIKKYSKRHRNVKLLNIYKKGKGLAVYKGFNIAKGKHIGFTDADNAVSPEEFYKLLNFCGFFILYL